MHILLNIGTKVVTKEITESTTYSDLENMIVASEGLEMGEFVIAMQGEEINSECTLFEAGVEAGSTLELGHVVEGGKKKKKRKQYKTPKKNSHRHVNVKLRILTYYNVEGDGQVSRTKLQSPFTKGSGRVTYMAHHKDGRYYCGKSHRALTKEADKK